MASNEDFICQFRCPDCRRLVKLRDMHELFDLAEAQMCAEEQQLYCRACIEGC